MDEYLVASMSVGWQLRSVDDEPIGRIEKLYLDRDTLRLRWVRVLDESGLRTTYVPILGLKAGFRTLITAVGADTVRDAPITASFDALTPTVQDNVFSYYAQRLSDAEVPSWTGTAELHEIAELQPAPPERPSVRGGRQERHDSPIVEAPHHFLQARAPERADLRDPIVVQARIATEAGGRSVALRSIDLAPDGADILLVLHHPGFSAIAPARQVVHLPQGAPSDWVAFEIKADHAGVHELIVSAFRDGTFLGELSVQVTADVDLSGGSTVEVSERLGSVGGTEGEVSLLINFDARRAVYTFQFVSADQFDEEITSSPLLQPPRTAVESLVGDLNRLARGASPFDAARTRRWLVEKGVGLWQGLIPSEVRRQFWDRVDRIASLTILSANDVVPWELLHPLDADRPADRGFLVEQFPLLRWVYGGAKVQQLPLHGKAAFVMPDDSPTTAAAEVGALQALLRSTGAAPISELEPLLARLDAADFDVLHFACHNTFDTAQVERTAVRMGGGPFDVSFLNSLTVTRRLRSRGPLVFMNACRSGSAGQRYTDITGWAQAFMGAGAGAFVGSMWEVRDSSARGFAEAFYEAMLSIGQDGKRVTLGQAIHRARTAIAGRSGDPTWLAYAAYGSSSATAS